MAVSVSEGLGDLVLVEVVGWIVPLVATGTMFTLESGRATNENYRQEVVHVVVVKQAAAVSLQQFPADGTFTAVVAQGFRARQRLDVLVVAARVSDGL